MSTDNSRYGVTKEDIMRAAMADFDDFDDSSVSSSSQQQSAPQIHMDDIYSDSGAYDNGPGYYDDGMGVQQGGGYAATVYCTACGNEMPADSSFCTACGNPLNSNPYDAGQQGAVNYDYADDGATIAVTPDSYGPNMDNVNYYGSNPYDPNQYPPEPNPYAQDAYDLNQYGQNSFDPNPYDQGIGNGDAFVFCTSCGAQISASMNFCTSCGAPVAQQGGVDPFAQQGGDPFAQGYNDPFAQDPNAGFGMQYQPEPPKKKGFFSRNK